jgi:hypothetical protein
MKLVTTALEWSYEAKASDVRAEMLEQAASLLVLRRDTLQLIDGAGPGCDSPPLEPEGGAQASGTQAEPVSSPHAQPEQAPSIPIEQVEQAGSRKKEAEHSTRSPTCTFSRVVVPIDLSRFLECGVAVVECPHCQAVGTLELHGGVLRFKAHDARKTTTPNTAERWARGETVWDVVGG